MAAAAQTESGCCCSTSALRSVWWGPGGEGASRYPSGISVGEKGSETSLSVCLFVCLFIYFPPVVADRLITPLSGCWETPGEIRDLAVTSCTAKQAVMGPGSPRCSSTVCSAARLSWLRVDASPQPPSFKWGEKAGKISDP